MDSDAAGSLVFDILLLATTRLYLLWSAGIAACAVIYLYFTRRQSLGLSKAG
jgi:hypothetical protein